MIVFPTSRFRQLAFLALTAGLLSAIPSVSSATSQWSRKTGLSCQTCHTVFPRLNSFGEDFLRNGYQTMVTYKSESAKTDSASSGGSNVPDEVNVGGIYLDKIDNLLGFRLNMTPIMWETNAFQKDSGSAKEGKLTLGRAEWIQFFVAGPIYKDISFFSELEYSKSAFKFNWFYFNFTNVAKSNLLNFQVGNISPLEFASYPDRLPQMSNIKGEVFHIKPSNGKGENSTKTRDAHGGVQYFGHQDWTFWYAGISPGINPTAVSQFPEYWTGIVLKLPESTISGFDGSTFTFHYQTGTDSKNTGTEASGGQLAQITNKWYRIIPSMNIRFNDKIDIQAAYLYGNDKNWSLLQNPVEAFKYSGVAVEAGYMPTQIWHLGLHYDNYKSDNKIVATGKPVLEYSRIVPALTYIMNENIRLSAYYEKELTDKPSDQIIDRVYLNLRLML